MKKLKNTRAFSDSHQEQRRKFHIAQQTKKSIHSNFSGGVRNLCAHLFTKLLQLFCKESAQIFAKYVPKRKHSKLKAQED